MTVTQLQQLLFCLAWVWPFGVLTHYRSSAAGDVKGAIFWGAVWIFCGCKLYTKKRWPFAGTSSRLSVAAVSLALGGVAIMVAFSGSEQKVQPKPQIDPWVERAAQLKTQQSPPSTTTSLSGDGTRSNSDDGECGRGMPAGVEVVEIPLEHVEGSDGRIWYDDYADDNFNKGWYFHFTTLNKMSGYCIVAVEYEVELESANGSILKGHGKKHLPPLAPNSSYSPDSKVPDDEVRFG